MTRPFAFFFLIILLLAGMTGCRYLSIPAKDDAVTGKKLFNRENDATVYNSAVIKGRINGPNRSRESTLIIAYRPGNRNREFTEYAIANPRGEFVLYLPQGRYQLFAVTDFNRNGVYEESEASGLYGSADAPEEIGIREGELITGIVIRTSKTNGIKIQLPVELSPEKQSNIIRHLTYNGQVLKTYHEYFSPENAQTGYWNPSSFMKAFGAHIYFAEEYNPRKIPVLFVHGTEGSPQNWIYFNMRLDPNRYQSWFFYYPSGMRLALAADLLNEELRELQDQYGFQKMAVVAHSVGGLMTRSSLTRHAQDKSNSAIKLFVTLATPWSGFGAADASQIMIHKSIPVWVDLGTHSDFIKNTMESSLPRSIKHYILYGKNDKLCGNGALDDRALACSISSYGFDCDHSSILSDRKVFLQFNKILEKEL